MHTYEGILLVEKAFFLVYLSQCGMHQNKINEINLLFTLPHCCIIQTPISTTLMKHLKRHKDVQQAWCAGGFQDRVDERQWIPRYSFFQNGWCALVLRAYDKNNAGKMSCCHCSNKKNGKERKILCGRLLIRIRKYFKIQ